jgi:hypothetical protein
MAIVAQSVEERFYEVLVRHIGLRLHGSSVLAEGSGLTARAQPLLTVSKCEYSCAAPHCQSLAYEGRCSREIVLKASRTVVHFRRAVVRDAIHLLGWFLSPDSPNLGVRS